jgi:hypothetical protein
MAWLLSPIDGADCVSGCGVLLVAVASDREPNDETKLGGGVPDQPSDRTPKLHFREVERQDG